MKKSIISFSILILLSVQLLVAQQKKDSTLIQLSDIEVSANSKKLYSEMGRILTIIDKAEISKSAISSLDQLLDYVAGVDIRQRGTNSIQADISVRGGSFDQVLVLLNGVNITDPQTGHFNLDIPLNLSDISRIEILQGSSARVLGPNAFSGAINIVTENNAKHALNAELVTGSYNYFGQAVSGNISNDKVNTFASISHKSSSGYMEFTDFELSNAYINSVINTKNVGKFNFQLAAQQKGFGANSFYSLKYPNQYEATKTFLSSGNWSMTKDKLIIVAQTSWRRHFDRFELYRDSITVKPSKYTHNYHLTDIINGKTSASYLSNFGKTTIGIDIRNEHVFSNKLGLTMDSMAVPFETNKFYDKSYNRLVSTVIIDHSVSLGNWYMSMGAASTYCKDFKFSNYGGIDFGYSFNEDIKVYASANSATRLPTFTDLFLVSSVQKGNINLKPEQSKTVETGMKINKAQWKLNFAVFYRMGLNVIDWIKPESSSIKYEASNLAEVNTTGGDLGAEYSFKESFLKKIAVSYSYLQMDKKAEGFDSKYALDYLKHKAIIKIDHRIWYKLSASWNAGYFVRSGNYDANTNPAVGSLAQITDYKPYFMIDSRLLWSTYQFDIFADANNILNENYADNGGIPQPGRTINVGVRLKLK
jgi:iron complex outermembrane receptor protein